MLLLLNIVTPLGLLQVVFLALSPAACGLTMDSVTICPCDHWLVTSTLPSLIPSITACGSLSLGLESDSMCNRLINLHPTHMHNSIESCPSVAQYPHSPWFTTGSVPCSLPHCVMILFPHRSILLIIHSRCLLTWRGRGSIHFLNTTYLLICSLSTFSLIDLSLDILISYIASLTTAHLPCILQCSFTFHFLSQNYTAWSVHNSC